MQSQVVRLYRYLFVITWLCCASVASGMQNDSLQPITPEQEAAAKAWIDNLYEIGVVIKGDSIHVSPEAQRLAHDTTLRKFVYRDTYIWQEAMYLLKQKHLKMGLWHLINLYDQDTANRESVLQYVLTLEGTLEMDKVLVAVFYTYALLDSQVGSIENGRPKITRPDIIERKLAVVNSLVHDVIAYRNMKANGAVKN